ncbi:MAG TPA: SulP family inorganic anion transporter [Cyclobacteriaceae bacterium]|nr:SulP family inorganic anion transporter [Cyclobacteriaceae bacterium]
MNFKEYFSNDLLASLVVFLVALPLCLGIALASGAPLQAGLIAGVAGGIVVGSLSGSNVSIAGPAAGLTTIVIAAIAELGSFEAFVLTVVLAGILQFIMGIIKAGTIGHFFPASVIKGMLAAIGLILILKQIPHAVGFDNDYEGDESFFEEGGRNTFTSIIEAFEAFSGGAVVVALVTITLIIVWEKIVAKKSGWLSFIPAPLLAVIVGVILSEVFKSSVPALAIDSKHMVTVPNFFSGDFGGLMYPDFSQLANPIIYKVAFTIALVASLETLLSIEACDKLDPLKRITPLNRELKAQGTANIISGLLGGLPVTSVIVRSSANINAGARTKASSITHGVILAASVLFLSNILQLIPLSALAGILIMVGYKLTPPKLYKEMFRKGWSQFLPFIVTVLAIVFTNLLLGVFIGILVSVFFILKTNFQEAVIMVGDGKNFLLKLTKNVSFLNKSTIRGKFLLIPSNSTVLIDGTEAHFVDQDIKEAIRDFIETSKTKQIEVELKHLVI